MTTLSPYLLFEGTCREAMEFYHSVFGGNLTMAKVSESPAKDHMPAFQQNKIVNARLESSAVDPLRIRLAHAQPNSASRKYCLPLFDLRRLCGTESLL